MKTFYALLTTLTTTLFANTAEAKTYTLGSGKWTDAKVWNNDYPGTTIKADDIVIITGQVTVNARIIVEGSLTVNKGAFMVGMKDLVISKSGKFVNNGNTVMNRIVNEGSISNNLLMEAMNDVDNKGTIENNNNMVTGNNFENFGGAANGTGGAYYVNNHVFASPAAKFGHEIKVFSAKDMRHADSELKTTSLFLNASLSAGNKALLNVSNPENLNITSYRIEKSLNGSDYFLLDRVSTNKRTLNYTDNKVGNDITYYKVKATNAAGEEIELPVATVKAAANTLSFVGQ